MPLPLSSASSASECRRAALYYEQRHNFVTAIPYHVRAAEQFGDVSSAWRVAHYYRVGCIVPMDEKKANQLFIQCHKAGHPGGRAVCLLFGLGKIKKDEKQGEILLSQLADEGDVDATYDLAFLERHKHNFKRALMLYHGAEKTGYPLILNDLAWMYFRGEGCDTDIDKSNLYLKQAADNRYGRAMYYYARDVGHFTPQQQKSIFDEATKLNGGKPFQ